jgi:hypothetical protein
MKTQNSFILGMLALPFVLGPLSVAFAGSVVTPNTFIGGTTALATEVNANFAAHQAAINDNNARILALSSDLNVLAVAHIDGFGTPSVSRSVNRVNGATISVSRSGNLPVGVYTVHFGFDVSDRYLFVSAGGQDAASGVGAALVSASPSAIFGSNALRVEVKNASGLVDTRFFISIQ